MSRTIRSTQIERQENITARLIDIVSAIEVLALLTDDPDDQKRLTIILEETLKLKHAAIERRNKKPGA